MALKAPNRHKKDMRISLNYAQLQNHSRSPLTNHHQRDHRDDHKEAVDLVRRRHQQNQNTRQMGGPRKRAHATQLVFGAQPTSDEEA